jgi:hypothetical protein
VLLTGLMEYVACGERHCANIKPQSAGLLLLRLLLALIGSGCVLDVIPIVTLLPRSGYRTAW